MTHPDKEHSLALLREWQAHHDATLKHLYSLIAEGRKRWEAEQ